MDPYKLLEALKEYQKYNPLHNDLEAYLYDMGEWAMGKSEVYIDDKPDPESYGLDNPQ